MRLRYSKTDGVELIWILAQRLQVHNALNANIPTSSGAVHWIKA